MSKSKVKSFLEKKDIKISFQRYMIDAMGAMALGLFASLLIGTIIRTIAENIYHVPLDGITFSGMIGNTELIEAANSVMSGFGKFAWILYQIGTFATQVTGAAMAVAIGYALKASPLVLFSLAAVGQATNTLGGSGGPLAVFFVAIITCEIGKLVSKETKIDILVTPAVTVVCGILIAMVIAPICMSICITLGTFIGWATDLHPFLLGMVVSVVVGIVLTLPISSAAICAAFGISGDAVLNALIEGSASIEIWNGLSLAGGAAVIGCSCHMLGYAIISFPENGIGGFVAQGVGTSMLQVPNLMKKPVLWLPPIITSAILGPIGTCLFEFRNNGAAITSGMGTCGFVGQIGVITGWGNMPEGFTSGRGLDILALILLTIVAPLVINYIIGKIFRINGIIQPGDLKINLG